MAELVFDMGKVINYKNAGEEIAYRDVVPIEQVVLVLAICQFHKMK